MNVYYESVKRLFDAGKLTADGVKKAVGIGWISSEEYTEITGEDYSA